MRTKRTQTWTRRAAGALAGLLAGAAGLAVAEVVAGLLSGVASPLLAVANRAVDETPRPLKEFAIETFGDADKLVLIGGVLTTVALLVAVAGALGVRRPRLAAGVFLGLAVVAGAAALTDRTASAGFALRLLPVLALVAVSIVALLLLLRPLRTPAVTDQHAPRGAEGDELPAAFDRRAFLVTAAAVGAVAVAGGVTRQFFLGAGAARTGVAIPAPDSPAARLTGSMTLDVDGITPYLTDNPDFYRVDTALQVPQVPVDGYRLRIHGMVDKELDLSFEDLLSRRLVERRITLTCVSNPVGGDLVDNATWIGVPIHELLREAGVKPGADAVKSTSSDSWTAGTPLSALLDEDRGALLAVAMNGEPLPLEHGFPVRMVTPGLYGYVSATKWLVDLEVTRFSDFKAYWTTRGYAEQAPIKTSSRIDVPGSFAQLQAGPTNVAGVAWSQNRGIEKVEVRVDGGPWNEARLADEDNIDTWRQWVWEWDAQPGSHRLEVRATDRTGNTQTSERTPIAPDGSTGWHSVNVTVS